MPRSRTLSPLAVLGRRGPRFEPREIGPGVVQLRLWTRAAGDLGFVSTPYRVDDVLVDSGFAHVRPLALDALAGSEVRAVCLTHHHEDHTGNAGPIAERHGCPVYLHRADLQGSEGVARMPAYRRLYWGRPAPYTAVEMPETIDTGRRTLRRIPTPGHSATHVALFDEGDGLVFIGDLYVAPGATAVMRHEGPLEISRSLRRVAALDPSCALNGHGLVLQRPARRLRDKAESIEAAVEQVLEGRARGESLGTIERSLWSDGWRKDRMFSLMTAGEFRRRNFVKSAIRASQEHQ